MVNNNIILNVKCIFQVELDFLPGFKQQMNLFELYRMSSYRLPEKLVLRQEMNFFIHVINKRQRNELQLAVVEDQNFPMMSFADLIFLPRQILISYPTISSSFTFPKLTLTFQNGKKKRTSFCTDLKRTNQFGKLKIDQCGSSQNIITGTGISKFMKF